MSGLRAPLVALVLLAMTVIELASGEREQRALQLAIAVAFIAPLAVRGRLPWLAAAVQSALLVVLGIEGLEPEAIGEVLGLLAAAYTAGALLERRPGVVALAVLAAGAALNTVLLGGAEDIFWTVGVFVLPPWFAGRLMRARREQEAQLDALNRALADERDRTARLTAEAERLRVAADIRTVLAGGLRDLTVRAERMADATAPPTAAEFAELRRAGAATTAELRRLLGLLH